MGKLWDRGAHPRKQWWNAFHQQTGRVIGVVATGGGRRPGGPVGAFGAFGRSGAPKRPISHPGARAGVIWLEPGGAGESYTSVSLMGIAVAVPSGIQRRWQLRVDGRSTYNFAYSQDSFSWKTGSLIRRNELAETRLLGAVSVHVPPKGCQSLQESVAVAAPLLFVRRWMTLCKDQR